MSKHRALQTIAAANGIAADGAFGAVVPPVYLSSTFAFSGFEQPGTYEYSRAGNPSRDLLADTIAKLEGGAGAIMLASGMAAVDLVLSRLKPGNLVIARTIATEVPTDCSAPAATGASSIYRSSIRATKSRFRRRSTKCLH